MLIYRRNFTQNFFMQFKYFDRPDLFGNFTDIPVTCNFCNEQTICFDGSVFFGENEVKAICPACLAAGRLAEKKITTCNADSGQLKRQLKKINRDLLPLEIDKIILQKTNELEYTTPAITSWQDWDWPCAEGDYCRFMGYGSIPMYKKLAGKKDPVQFFIKSIYYNQKDEDDAETLWEKSMPEKEINNHSESNQYGTLFYVFKSLHSNKIITVWDSE